MTYVDIEVIACEDKAERGLPRWSWHYVSGLWLAAARALRLSTTILASPAPCIVYSQRALPSIKAMSQVVMKRRGGWRGKV